MTSNQNQTLDLLVIIFVWFKYDLDSSTIYASQVRLYLGLSSGPPDHGSTFHVTEMLLVT